MNNIDSTDYDPGLPCFNPNDPIVQRMACEDLAYIRDPDLYFVDRERAQRLCIFGYTNEQIAEVCKENQIRWEIRFRLETEEYMKREAKELKAFNREQAKKLREVERKAAVRKEVEAEMNNIVSSQI